MATVKEGDRVRIVTRPPTDDDTKTGMYYGHFGGLVGSVQKIYSKQEVAVEIDHESLTREVRKRHEDVRNQMKTRWLDGLSEEGRSRLTEREKDFNLRYVILVGMADLEKVAGARAGAQPAIASQEPARGEPTSTPEAPPRRTLADLDAAEEAELQRRRSV